MEKYGFKNEWTTTENDIEGMVKWAQTFGSDLAKPTNDGKGTELTTSQLRKFFGEVKRQQSRGFNKSDFILLKPKLAYAVGRAGKKDKKERDLRIKQFYYVMANAIDSVNNEKDFKRFIKIFEAIVAYHKAAEESNLTVEK